MTATTSASTPQLAQWRKGITVFAREIIPGDRMMDRGVVREVASLSVADSDDGHSLVNFEPLDGYPPRIRVANRVQVYVRRVCRDEHSAPGMPVVDERVRALFAHPPARRPDPLVTTAMPVGQKRLQADID